MRAGYGKNLRELFISKVRIDEILDFGGILVFNSATVDTCTLRLSKNAPQKNFPSSYMRSTFALLSFISSIYFTYVTWGMLRCVDIPGPTWAVSPSEACLPQRIISKAPIFFIAMERV